MKYPKQIPFPQVGDVLKFRGVPDMYYPMFTCIGELANSKLVVGQKCTVRKVEIHSSWCAVWLEEIPGDESYLNLIFFSSP